MALPLMIQGTASSSGKSLIAAALCRMFYQDGYRVAPFKAQNMSNNSFVTGDGCEMGRAQVVQAYASGLEPDVRMNPILLKPSSNAKSQVVLRGKPAFTLDAYNWHEIRERLRKTVYECYHSLENEYDLVVIEGAGSPAEINLKKNDIVNMGMAKMASSPVVIVGDIDRGGVFASLVGTMQLFDDDERERVKGFIINKFRGKVDLLKPGLDQLERITGVPVLGVVPWIDHAIDDEDCVSERFSQTGSVSGEIDICIIRFPHLSNFTDFIPLESIPGVRIRWCGKKDRIGSPDLLILPGTKSTIADLQQLKQSGIANAIVNYARSGGTILGICGGFQMLGEYITDPDHTESELEKVEGLHLLEMTTMFHLEKQTVQTKTEIHVDSWRLLPVNESVKVDGYEIHMGQSEFGVSTVPFTSIVDASERRVTTGVADSTGCVAGTYCHGLFDSGTVVRNLTDALRSTKGLSPLTEYPENRKAFLEKELNHLAGICRKQLDITALMTIMKEFQNR